MKHLGNIVKISGYTVSPVDVITCGSPCQDLSVAGKREGLGGARSGLFMESVRIVKEMRGVTFGQYPKYFVWENVPGAFSSNNGEDFRAVLEELSRICDENADIPRPAKGKWHNCGSILGDGYSLAWRTMDAQFWGVPQRRRRIALVVDFRGHTAPEILFKPESVQGYFRARPEKGQRDTADTQSGIGAASTRVEPLAFNGRQDPVSGFVTGAVDSTLPPAQCVAVFENHGHDTRFTGLLDTAPACNRQAGTGGNDTPLAVQPIPFACNQRDEVRDLGRATSAVLAQPGMKQQTFIAQPLCYSVDEGAGKSNCSVFTNLSPTAGSMGETVELAPTLLGARADAAVFQQSGFASYTEGCGTLRTTGGNIGGGSENLLVTDTTFGVDCRNAALNEELYPTLQAKANGDQSLNYSGALLSQQSVRKLTPLEYERLQGFPAGWTDIGDWVDSKGKKKQSSDSARYKALGNSIALPQWYYVLGNISERLPFSATLGSLFDGIGGFPLVWSDLHWGNKAQCLWASEIEDFCIAVTKKRFGED